MADSSPLALAAPAEPPATPYPHPRRTQGNYQELPMQPLASMAVPWIVTSVLAEHDLGQFQRSALLWEQMRRDDRVAATMSVRINAILGLEHDFVSARGQPDASQAVLEQMENVWTEFASPPERRQILSWALGMGFAFGRLEWEMTRDEWRPKLSIWHPCFVTWRSDQMAYYVTTANAGQVRITPGEDGWWLWTPFGFKHGWTYGYVHQLATPWLARTWSYRDWCRYNEIHGLPMLKAFTPMNAQDDDETRFISELANRAAAPVVRLPRDREGNPAYDFELVEAKADTWQAFQGMKGDANVDIAVAVLGQNLTTEVQGGSFAAAKIQDRVRTDILESDARGLESFFNLAVAAPYAQFNLAQDSKAPELRLQTQLPADMKEVGEGLKAVGEGVAAALAAGMKLDVDELTLRSDIPTTGDWEEPEPPAPPPQPPGLPPGAPGGGRPPPFTPRQVLASEGNPETEEEREGRLGAPSMKTTQEQGQAYADAIVEIFTRQGAAALNPDRLRVLSVIMQAESFEEMQHLLEKAYADMDPQALAELMGSATALAELNGWYSARGT